VQRLGAVARDSLGAWYYDPVPVERSGEVEAMRSEQVITNVTCNQNCTFCVARRTAEDPSFIRFDAVRGRIDAAVAAGAREIVFTGGEPMMRRDLSRLVAHARQQGVETIVLETNGTLLNAAQAQELKQVGLSLARVHLDGGPGVDAVTRDPEGFVRTVAGIQTLLDSDVPVEVAAAVVRSTQALLPDLPRVLLEQFGDVKALRGIVVSVPLTSPDPAELLQYDAAGETISRLADAARKVGLAVRLAPESALPPCALPSRARHAHLFSLTAGGATRSGFARVDACNSCQVADRCPGIRKAYLDQHGTFAARPIKDDHLRRRLSLIGSVEAQIARELVTPNRRGVPGQPAVEERVIRVNFHCNQACRFCFVSTHLPPAQDDAVRQAIVAAGHSGARITLSGGEPALNPKLVDYVRLARASSSLPIELQTNATRLDDMTLVRALEAAGLDEAFVSLHGSTGAISDAVTETPGTFEKTLIGLDNLIQTKIAVMVNFVICQKNQHDLVPYVRMVAARWPKAVVNLSFVAPSTDLVPRDRDLVPKYSEALAQIAEALAVGRELGMHVTGFEGMCGIPLCLVPDSMEPFYDKHQIPDGFDQGEFLKPAACARCDLNRQCFGIRRGYAELYGSDELRAVQLAH
jgi:MoaA/NifB/PqqE/SkfB family radical SAM enzyme